MSLTVSAADLSARLDLVLDVDGAWLGVNTPQAAHALRVMLHTIDTLKEQA